MGVVGRLKVNAQCRSPDGEQPVQEFCTSTYEVTFPVFAKIEVNGPDADPLYQWLRPRPLVSSAAGARDLGNASPVAAVTRPARGTG